MLGRRPEEAPPTHSRSTPARWTRDASARPILKIRGGRHPDSGALDQSPLGLLASREEPSRKHSHCCLAGLLSSLIWICSWYVRRQWLLRGTESAGRPQRFRYQGTQENSFG